MDRSFDWRRSDRRLFAWSAAVFTAIVLFGFARTYYLKIVTGASPLPSMLVHAHGLVMTLWVAFFVAQVWLIRSKQARLHMKLGMFSIALAVLLIVVGFFTAAAAGKFGSQSSPADISPISFMIVPMADLVIFAGLFGAAIYYRKRPASHKRLMLLTAINFLPPALARFPFEAIPKLGPIFFFGVPSVLAVGLLAFDTWRNRKLNVPFLVGSLILIASYPSRMVFAFTETWISFATWLTTWAA